MPFYPGDPNINRKGRPVNAEAQELRDAIKLAKEKNKKGILQHFVERAYEDNGVLVALIKKIVPDKTHLEADVSSTVVMMPTIKIDDTPIKLDTGD